MVLPLCGRIGTGSTFLSSIRGLSSSGSIGKWHSGSRSYGRGRTGGAMGTVCFGLFVDR